MAEATTKFTGTVTDIYRSNLYGAKILLMDEKNIVLKDNAEKPIATESDDKGKWTLDVPSKWFTYGDLYLTARHGGKEEKLKITPNNLEVNFIIGVKTQEEKEVTVTGCKTFKCKLKKAWNKNKSTYIYAIVSLIILAIILTIILSTSKSEK